MTTTASRAPAVPFWLWPWCAFLFLVPFKQLIPGGPFISLEVFAAALLALAPRQGASLANGRFLAVSVLFLMLALSFFFSPHQPPMTLYWSRVLRAASALCVTHAA